MNRKIIALFILSSTLFFADRITKQYALAQYQDPVHITSFLTYTTHLNTGMAFSLFHAESLLGLLAILTLIFLVMCYFIRYAYQQWKKTQNIPWGCALVITGALSNVCDRVMYGGVVDFILLHYHEYAWPIFNLADMFICLGIALLFLNRECL